MKRNRPSIMLLTVIIVMILALPAFADDELKQEPEQSPGSVQAETILKSDNAETTDPESQDYFSDTEMRDERSEDSEQPKADKASDVLQPKDSLTGVVNVRFNITGKGSAEINDGRVSILPDPGWIISSITADRDIVGCEAGSQIDEFWFDENEIAEDMVFNIVFDKEATEDLLETEPLSQTAIFEGVWNDEKQKIE